jgi:hypothetical protein
LIDQLSCELRERLPQKCELIVPLGIGNHVDHELTRKAASRLERDLLYYADYPYVREEDGKEILEIMERSPEWEMDQLQVSDRGLESWWESARTYGSQLSTFWKDEDALRRDLRDFSSYLEGMRLWRALEEEG